MLLRVLKSINYISVAELRRITVTPSITPKVTLPVELIGGKQHKQMLSNCKVVFGVQL